MMFFLQGDKLTIQPLGVGCATRPKKAQNGGYVAFSPVYASPVWLSSNNLCEVIYCDCWYLHAVCAFCCCWPFCSFLPPFLPLHLLEHVHLVAVATIGTLIMTLQVVASATSKTILSL